MALARCLDLVVTAALTADDANVALERMLIEGLNACTSASASCVHQAVAEASATGAFGAAAMAKVVGACELQSKPPLPLTLLESVVVASHVWALRIWSLLGAYNALQLVIMPWVFLWTFSGTIVGLVRFAKFQYHIVYIGVDVLIMAVLYVLLFIEDLVSSMLQAAYARCSQSFHKRYRLENNVRNARTFFEYKEADLALAEFRAQEEGRRCGARRKSSRTSNHGDEADQIVYLRAALDRMTAGLPSSALQNLATLEPLIVREAGGFDWVGEDGGEELLQRLSNCLVSVCDAHSKAQNPAVGTDLLAWLYARQKALGITALCLSGGGSLAMYHMGVCRFLLEEQLMPEVVSGVSGGAIVAAFLAIHSDEELLQHVFIPSIVVRHHPQRWFPPLWQELLNFIRIGVLVPTEYFEQTAGEFYGTWTFEEAYKRTGRNVSIVISSNFSEKLPACIMLNHMTAPRVTIASAVATSCAAVGIMKPRGLIEKDGITGELRPFEILGKSFVDGTFVAEVPKDYLRSIYGATQFLVSQVNPHVSAFLGRKESALQTLRTYFGRDLQTRARLLSEYRLLPSFFGRAMCKATKHLSQDFGGPAPDGLTVFPPNMGLESIKAAVTNPSERDMEHYLLGGQQMAWCRAREIRVRMHVEVTIAGLIRTLRLQQQLHGSTTISSLEQPPPHPGMQCNSSGSDNGALVESDRKASSRRCTGRSCPGRVR
mmetsp:Transcript_133123/g.259186  ORF Transcript_133123/g.259186 Transcript_133123/m.259186 type:complete len:714 (+) Transcript_133123:45-2186(+)